MLGLHHSAIKNTTQVQKIGCRFSYSWFRTAARRSNNQVLKGVSDNSLRPRRSGGRGAPYVCNRWLGVRKRWYESKVLGVAEVYRSSKLASPVWYGCGRILWTHIRYFVLWTRSCLTESRNNLTAEDPGPVGVDLSFSIPSGLCSLHLSNFFHPKYFILIFNF